MKRGKRMLDDESMIYTSSTLEWYLKMFKDFRRHPYKMVEYYTGKKLPLWKRVYIDFVCKFKKSSYENKQNTFEKVIKPYIRKR